MATIKSPQIIDASDNVERGGPSHTTGGNVNGAAIVEKSLAAPQKVKCELPYDPAIRLLGI